MNILIISEPLFPIDGTSSRTSNLARSLSNRGHKIIILTLRESLHAPLEEKLFNQCHIIRFERGLYPARFYLDRRAAYSNFFLKGECLHFYKKIVDIVKVHEIDALYCSNYLPSVMGIIFRPFIMKPIICDLQASVSLESRSRGAYLESIVGKIIEIMACDHTDGVTVPVNEYKEYLSQISKKGAERCYVIPNCVNLNIFKPNSVADTRKRLNLPYKNHLIFFHGSPYPENFKALKILNQVIDRLNKKGLETKALVAGHFKDMETQTKNMIFTGWLSQEKLAQYINVADIAILPVFTKCLGISTRLIEYMASGKATITTKDNATGLNFAIKEGGLIAVDTLEEITEAAATLLENVQIRESISKNARAITEKYLSPESIGLQLESIIKKLI